LLDHTVARARALKLIAADARDDKTQLVAADATGMESRHTSTYFGKRSGRKLRRFPKFWAVVHAASHVCLALACGGGPGPDDPRFAPIVRDARRRMDDFKVLTADCGFDGEPHQQMLDALGILGMIPPERGRPRTRSGANKRGGFFRNFWHHCWRRVKHLYGQRWQVETFFSMLKRLLDSFLRATKRWSRHREMCLKVITLNLMLVARAAGDR
jgi:transposase